MIHETDIFSKMTAPGSMDALGRSKLSADKMPIFEVPTRQHPESGYFPLGGSNRDMGTLALFLVANWYVTGETVLIDGGVSHFNRSYVQSYRSNELVFRAF